MALNLSFDRETLRRLPVRLRVVLAVILGGLAIDGIAFLADDLMNDSVLRVAALRAQLTEMRRQDQTLHHKIEDYPEKRRLYDQAMASGMLTSLDRGALIGPAQELAAKYHLRDLRYRLEPQATKTDPVGKYRVGSTLVTLESGALLDSDALGFWDDLLAALPARYQITEADLERTGEVTKATLSSIQGGPMPSLVTVKLVFHWISLHPISQEAP